MRSRFSRERRRIASLSPTQVRSLMRGTGVEMLRGIAGTLALRCTAAAAAFLLTAILARRLGASGYGVYAWALACASILQIITVFGFDILVIREFASYRATRSWSAMRGLLRTAPVLVFMGSAVVSLVLTAAGLSLVDPSKRTAFVVAMAIVPVLALLMLCQGAVQGVGSVAIARFPNDLVAPIVYLGLLSIGWDVLGFRHSAPVAMALQGVAALAALLISAVTLYKLLPSAAREAPPTTSQATDWVRSAVALGLVNSMAIALAQIDIVLLGILGRSSQVGLYSTSARVANAVGIAELAVNAAYLPVVARLFATGRIDRLRERAPLVTLAATLLSAAIATPFIVFAPWILGLFGEPFRAGTPILRMLCVAFVISAAAGQNGTVLMMTRQTRPMLVGSGLALAVNIVLNLVLIQWMAARGAAVAWLLTVVFWNGVLSWQVRRLYGFSATLTGLLTVLRERSKIGARIELQE